MLMLPMFTSFTRLTVMFSLAFMLIFAIDFQVALSIGSGFFSS